MTCSRCGTELLPGKKFCHECGAAAAQGCPNCGSPLAGDFRFCPDCGHALRAETEHAERPRAPQVPESLAQRIRREGISTGERKQVTVFFCDLVGSTALAEGLDPEVWRDVLDEYLERVFAEIHKVEGVVNQLAGDGFMALFGAPIAHEDAPVRAVRAALAVQARLAELSEEIRTQRGFELHARIGIHTGMVVAGTVGNDLKMDYTAVGDTTNLAARLQALADPGSILISASTERLVRGWFRTRHTGPFEVKGKSAPVWAWEVLAESELTDTLEVSAERGLTPFVGRDGELAQLVSCFERSRDLGQVVAVVGDAGSGKSRLVHEFKQRLAETHGDGAAGLTVFEARCAALTQGVPYAPWMAMLRTHLGLGPAASNDCVCDRLREVLGEGEIPERNAQYLMKLLCGTSAGVPSEDEAGRDGTFEAFELVVKSAARRGPVLMIIEDLHWIDEPSLEMLERAVAGFGAGRSMLLVTHRSDYGHAWSSNAALTQLRLRPLAERDARAIVRARAGGELPAALERRLLERGEGNPFFLEELTRALVEQGTLVPGARGVDVTRPIEAIAIPETVQELLGARLDRLSPAAKRVAQVAAVFGRQFRRDLLARLFEDQWIDSDSELAELERQGIVRALPGEDAEYRFGESLTQEVAYEGLLLSERRRLHGRIAELLASERDPDTARRALIARHLARSDDRERAIEMLLESAAQAADLPAYAAAMGLYTEALELGEALLAEHGDGVAAAARERHERQIVTAARGLVGVGAVHSSQQSDVIERASVRGLELAAKLDDPEAQAVLCALYGTQLVSRDPTRFREGIELAEQGVRVAERAGLAHTEASTRRILAMAYVLDGRFDEARQQIGQALETLERLGEHRELTDTYLGARFFQARVLLAADELAAVQEISQRWHEVARERNNRTLRSGLASLLAQVAFVRDDLAEAERWAREALEVGSAIGNRSAALTGVSVLIGVRAERGEQGLAAGEREHIQDGLGGTGNLSSNVDLTIEALSEAGLDELALQAAQARADASAGRLTRASSLLSLGQVLLRAAPERAAEAKDALAEGRRLAHECGARSLLARLDAELARLAGDEQATLRAAEALEQLGFPRYARRLRAPRPAEPPGAAAL